MLYNMRSAAIINAGLISYSPSIISPGSFLLQLSDANFNFRAKGVLSRGYDLPMWMSRDNTARYRLTWAKRDRRGSSIHRIDNLIRKRHGIALQAY